MNRFDEAYVRGFIDKCAERRIDPEYLLKAGQASPGKVEQQGGGKPTTQARTPSTGEAAAVGGTKTPQQLMKDKAEYDASLRDTGAY